MNQTEYIKTAIYEHRFWLQILGDHSRFIHSALAPNEKANVKQAKQFIVLFDQLLEDSRKSVNHQSLLELSKKAYDAAGRLREYKLAIIRNLLIGKLSIHLTAVFLNHMVNELDEYIRILSYLVHEKAPPKQHEVHHHLLWLLDAAGHAGAISDSMNRTETKLKTKSLHFTQQFEHFYLKAVEIAGFLRANLNDFPVLERFNESVNIEMKIFKTFLRELEEMGLSKQLLSTLTPLMADHMAREECYYLNKLADTSTVSPPGCDPTKPRVTG
ncbi:DUF2935 domain-containing protein [Pseudalkalibacillus caeni]|uniref:DUF2935 domain-containing protein n=1 Tax=Exobacillus caeni TaxID=2574798 RepID=A0A5R9F1S8_9BACL|nr:DUF2935 domain-containing protein [Pseudalkalibacillus caeni]TLS37537.1 DUF2935 domain-containing protein [Pseudalkalibacillus caeni]